MNKKLHPLLTGFRQGMKEEDDRKSSMPQRLRDRASWFKARGRNKDAVLMNEAAEEIEHWHKITKPVETTRTKKSLK